MSAEGAAPLGKNSLNCSIAMGSSLTCNLFLIKCRASGAQIPQAGLLDLQYAPSPEGA
jgi:hypothetical protein